MIFDIGKHLNTLNLFITFDNQDSEVAEFSKSRWFNNNKCEWVCVDR